MVLPSGFTSTIAAIDTADGPQPEPSPPFGDHPPHRRHRHRPRRHDLPAHKHPTVSQDHRRHDLLMDETQPSTSAQIHHQTHHPHRPRPDQTLHYKLNINTTRRDETATTHPHDIGLIRLRTTPPLLADPYRRQPHHRGFILIDETTNRTSPPA